MEKDIRTDIIPDKILFRQTGESGILNYKAICCYAALGFFIDEDSYWTNIKTLQPSTIYKIDEKGALIPQHKYFKWHYNPKDISFSQAVDEFTDLFEKITVEKLKGKKVILALSGGLDSRTQATALKESDNDIFAYSYKFQNGSDEIKYGRAIAENMGWKFKGYTIERGYLWNCIEELADINQCYADFTSCRQMAVRDKFSLMGDIFYLGHGGDLFFDDMSVQETLDFPSQLEVLMKKIVRKSGYELGRALWVAWGLGSEEQFDTYLKQRIAELLEEIKIENANSRLRAFKSIYYVPKWTIANISIFQKYHEVYMPYFDNRMCEFICTIPEKYLSKRQIQIEYMKRKTPELAAIPWQSYAPCNLYNYKDYNSFSIQTKVMADKINRKFNQLLTGKICVTRNWENQFLGENNKLQLTNRLFHNDKFKEFIPEEIVKTFYNKFYKGSYNDKIWYSHSIGMLLTMSLFASKKL